MDFFEAQDSARRSTRRLVILFALAVAALIVSIYFVVIAIFGREQIVAAASSGSGLGGLWNGPLFAAVTVATVLVVGAGSGWKTFQLSSGGSVVAEMLGGRILSPDTADLDERRVLNVVEEMALASGVPVPTVYLLEREQGINAFAAGFNQNDAVIGVTRGCMELLSRDEMQGVIGHEFSHILNGDMRINIRLIGVLHGILVISLIGYFILRSGGGRSSGSSKKGGGGGILLLGLALYILGYLGVFFGKLIKAAVSRQREYLADGAAVQFTRNPPGLAGALKKIGGLASGSKVESTKAQEASHLFFANALSSGFSQLLSTHPPLADRVKKLDPSFDGNFPPVKMKPAAGEDVKRQAESSRERLGEVLRPVLLGTAAAAVSPPTPARTSIASSAGALTETHLTYVSELLEATPGELRDAAHEPAAAQGLILALLLDPSDETRRVQLNAIEGKLDPAVAAVLPQLGDAARGASPAARLPLVDLAMPALKRMSAQQYDVFRQAVSALVDADRRISLFEYALQRALLRHLAPHFTEVKRPATSYYALGQLARECAVVLSALAHFGSHDEAGAVAAFNAGVAMFGRERAGLTPAQITFLPRAECTLREFDAALGKLVSISPALKRAFLEACEAAVATDHAISLEEGEMLRVIADSLDVPVPPLVPGQRVAKVAGDS
ncbi:MAG: M48 family metallopeptidase [Thermoanaerobaculia bacterium]